MGHYGTSWRLTRSFVAGFIGPFEGSERYLEHDPGAFAGLRLNREGASQEMDPLFHTPEAPTLQGSLRGHDLSRCKPLAVVFDNS